MECRESEGFFYDSNNKPGICTTLLEEKILISEITWPSIWFSRLLPFVQNFAAETHHKPKIESLLNLT